MMSDEEVQALVARANMIVAKGFGRNLPFPEHIAVDSPIVAAVFNMLVAEQSPAWQK